MNVVNSGLVHGEVIATLESWHGPSSRITLTHPSLEDVSGASADRFIVLSNVICSSVALLEEKEKSLRFELFLSFHLRTQQNDEMAAELTFVKDRELTAPVENFEDLLNYLYLGSAAHDKIGHTVGPSLGRDETIDVRE